MSADKKLANLEDRNINRRLLELRKTLGMSRKAFGECAGMSDSVIKNIEYGLTSPRMYLINMVCEKYGVRDEWVLEGTGEMFRDPVSDENTENGTSERIKNVRKTLGLSREAFAEKLRTSQFVIRNIEYGLTEVKPMLIEQICDAFWVNKDWIVNGEGEMFQNRMERVKLEMALDLVRKMPENSSIKRLVMSLADLSPEDLGLVEQFASLMGEVLRRK